MTLRPLLLMSLAMVAAVASAQSDATPPPPVESFVVVQQDGARHTQMMVSGKQVVVIEHRNGFEIRRPTVANPEASRGQVDPGERRFFMNLAEARQGDGQAMELFGWVQDEGLRKHGPGGFGSLSRRSNAFGPGSFGPDGFGPSMIGPGSLGPPGFGPPGFGPRHINGAAEAMMDTSGMLDRMNQSTLQGLSDMDKRRKEAADQMKQRDEEMKRLQEKLKRSTRFGF